MGYLSGTNFGPQKCSINVFFVFFYPRRILEFILEGILFVSLGLQLSFQWRNTECFSPEIRWKGGTAPSCHKQSASIRPIDLLTGLSSHND